MPFKFSRMEIPEVVLVEYQKFGDNRGAFSEHYKASEFRANGIAENFLQDNYSESKRGVLRGLHYQLEPMEQGKLVSVLSGRVFDVAVDIRKGSKTFGKWVGAELSAENRRMLYVPAGFAHGFLALEDNSTVLYKVTKEYSKQHERGIIWNDSAIGIKWPQLTPILSDKDAVLPKLADAEINFKA
jgi:dTDP-4-dehydrorhamnose 3,5-epimerase